LVLVTVRFTFQANKIEEAKTASIFRQARASEEDGCISFRMYQDLEDPRVFFLFEEWESQEALEAHWENMRNPALPKAPEWPEMVNESIAMRYEVASYGKLRR